MEEQVTIESNLLQDSEMDFSHPLPKKRNLGVLITFGIIIVLVLGVLLTLYKNQSNVRNSAETESPAPSVYKTEFRGEIPSSCGYSLGWPTTVVTDESYQEWIYEEVRVSSDSFRGLAPLAITNNGVLMATMLFKRQDEKFVNDGKGEGQYKIIQPGLVSYCTNNSSKWDLKEFVANVEKSSNDQLKYTITGERDKWGQIDVQQIEVEGILSGGYVKEPFFLAIIPSESDFSRLVIFQPWASKEDRLDTDREAIISSLTERKLTSVLTFSQTNSSGNSQYTDIKPSTKPECTQYKIYEGQFVSDKCYSKQDLSDLLYYLKRYNNAVLDQNNAARSSKITCNGSTFFKSECENDKLQYEQALKDQDTYKIKVNEIIAKGK